MYIKNIINLKTKRCFDTVYISSLWLLQIICPGFYINWLLLLIPCDNSISLLIYHITHSSVPNVSGDEDMGIHGSTFLLTTPFQIHFCSFLLLLSYWVFDCSRDISDLPIPKPTPFSLGRELCKPKWIRHPQKNNLLNFMADYGIVTIEN